ncbi:MAG: hypothetical protein RR357_00980 [Clostridia bacterium]
MENLQTEQTVMVEPTEVAQGIALQETQPIEAETVTISDKRFKTSDELQKAYSSLEKEFTKRSQRLKVLEREMESKMETPSPVYSQENWQERVEKFVSENPSAKPFKKDIAKVILNGELTSNPNCLELALSKVLINNYRTPNALLEDSEFLDNHVFKNDKIREKIIKDYLCSVNNVRSPKTISGGGQPALAPQNRPKSFDEAGKMAIKLSSRGK